MQTILPRRRNESRFDKRLRYQSMLLFPAIPMILGDLLQQCYNIADTPIVGQFLGRNALAAVGSSFTLMTFLTSIILGLCMGSGALLSIRFGQRDENGLCEISARPSIPPPPRRCFSERHWAAYLCS